MQYNFFFEKCTDRTIRVLFLEMNIFKIFLLGFLEFLGSITMENLENGYFQEYVITSA